MPRRLPLMFAYSLPFLQQIDPPAGGGNPPAPPVDPPEVKFDDAQQKKLNDLLAAERKATADKVRADLKAESEAAEKKAKDDREADDAKKRGDFEKVETTLKGELETHKQAAERLKSENETFATIFEAQYVADVNEVPAEIWAELKPADDAPLTERITALKRAQKIAGLVSTTSTPTGSRPIPKPGSQQTSFDEEVAKQRQKPSYKL